MLRALGLEEGEARRELNLRLGELGLVGLGLILGFGFGGEISVGVAAGQVDYLKLASCASLLHDLVENGRGLVHRFGLLSSLFLIGFGLLGGLGGWECQSGRVDERLTSGFDQFSWPVGLDGVRGFGGRRDLSRRASSGLLHILQDLVREHDGRGFRREAEELVDFFFRHFFRGVLLLLLFLFRGVFILILITVLVTSTSIIAIIAIAIAVASTVAIVVTLRLFVDLLEDLFELREVALLDHSVRFVNDEVLQGGEVGEVLVLVGAHQLPKTTWGSHDDLGASFEDASLLFCGEAANEGGHPQDGDRRESNGRGFLLLLSLLLFLLFVGFVGVEGL
mmetsp:Transcript_7433/g.13440  ORF Transcript_7433/g.13440 Transcript_7433/m.13440 type:complete len:336 (-) Transcript_7433:221-1228(-)